MPVTLDPSLPPSLYPLAWLVGSWQGAGALHHPTPEGPADRRVEQQLDCVANQDGTLTWTSLVHVIDDPAPHAPPSTVTIYVAPAPTPVTPGGAAPPHARRACGPSRRTAAGLRGQPGRHPHLDLARPRHRRPRPPPPDQCVHQ